MVLAVSTVFPFKKCPLLPAASASVPYGLVLVRVRVRAGRGGQLRYLPERYCDPLSACARVDVNEGDEEGSA